MQVVWCNRYSQRAERLPGTADREVKSPVELAVLVGASLELSGDPVACGAEARGDRGAHRGPAAHAPIAQGIGGSVPAGRTTAQLSHHLQAFRQQLAGAHARASFRCRADRKRPRCAATGNRLKRLPCEEFIHSPTFIGLDVRKGGPRRTAAVCEGLDYRGSMLNLTPRP